MENVRIFDGVFYQIMKKYIFMLDWFNFIQLKVKYLNNNDEIYYV